MYIIILLEFIWILRKIRILSFPRSSWWCLCIDWPSLSLRLLGLLETFSTSSYSGCIRHQCDSDDQEQLYKDDWLKTDFLLAGPSSRIQSTSSSRFGVNKFNRKYCKIKIKADASFPFVILHVKIIIFCFPNHCSSWSLSFPIPEPCPGWSGLPPGGRPHKCFSGHPTQQRALLYCEQESLCSWWTIMQQWGIEQMQT